ncbi:MAG: nucleotidyltransferase domain-containing protein [Nanoarchaeota archaeon]
MIEITQAEQKALLIIYKDFTHFHNANSLSGQLGITQVGTMKLLKRFEKVNIISSKRIGKSIIYKINIEEELTRKLIGFALVNEAKQYERWKEEFKPIYGVAEIVLFYGSASRNYTQARDIDIFIVQDKEDMKETYRKLKEIEALLPKKVHEIQATSEEFLKNLRARNETLIEIIKTAIILGGYDKYMEILNEFAKF